MGILSYQPAEFMEAAKSASVIDGPNGPLLLLSGRAFEIVCPIDENKSDITALFAKALRQSSPSETAGSKA